jgi:hypothetical protein
MHPHGVPDFDLSEEVHDYMMEDGPKHDVELPGNRNGI